MMFISNTHLRDLLNKFLFRKMLPFACFLLFSISGFIFYVIRLLIRYVFRFHGEDAYKKDDSNCFTFQSEITKLEDSKADEPGEKDTPKFSFKFQNQTLEETHKGNEEFEKCPMVSTSKCQFFTGKDFCGFMEEPEVVSFTVNELYADSNINGGFLPEKDLLQLKSETETVQEEIVEDFTVSHYKTGKTEAETVTEEQLPDKEWLVDSAEIQFQGEKGFFVLDSETESISLSDEFFSLENLSLDPEDGFLSDTEEVEMTEEIQSSQVTRLQNSIMVSTETMDTSDQLNIEELEQTHFLNSRFVDIEIVSESDIEEDDEEEEEEAMDGSAKIEEPDKENIMQRSSVVLPGPEEGNELETLWEHQHLIEQLKMELKKVRATGLPTILEESESPRVMEDLKPWKIDEKFLHEDRMDELHKFYNSYTERMRKFDILNYQKMYAIGFLQLKDPLQSISNRKSSNPAITSLLSQNFCLGKYRRAKVDPTVKFIRELQNDLEMVYVGQMCLSWEILHWQYGKAQELQESDTYGIHRYNQVAGEFQQFQVLMQRFLENEAFQGPRIQNYVKNRCVLRNLIQVPVIKEDSFKDKKKARRGDDDAITVAMLTEIIEKSMRIFWEFVRADKEEASIVLKSLWRTQIELQNPADLELLTDIRTNIQKKEKMLKDNLRSGNCIVKRFQKRQEDTTDLILFFSQVDMKLISRVLNMSRITSEQLVWCHKKLNKINFVYRKIRREPSFLLFPC